MKLHPNKAARQASKSPHPTDAVGYCLRQVRKCYGIDALWDDAAEAWREAHRRHPEVDPAAIPRGVPIFWTGGSGGHGHIAISSGHGNGLCWSTDIRRAGYFDHVPIEEIGRTWGLTLVGWTEDLNGVRVWTKDPK